MSSVSFTYDWDPDDYALRARLARLAQQATTLGCDISAPARKARNAQLEAQARRNFAEAYAEKQRREPGFVMTLPEQEREIERMRTALVRLKMTETAHRRGDVRAAKAEAKARKSRPTLADESAAPTPSTRSRLSTTEHNHAHQAE